MTTGFPVSPLTPATFLLVGLCRHRARRSSALHRAVAVRGLAADGGRGASSSECSRCDRVDPHRLRRRLLRRSHRAGRGAGGAGAPRLPRVRVPGRADHCAGAAAQGARSGGRLRSAARRTDARRAAGVRRRGRDDRHQHGRGQSGRGCRRGPRRGPRASGWPACRSRPSPATTCWTWSPAGEFAIDETGAPVESLGDALVSANAYIGAAPIVEALAPGRRTS